MAEEEGRGLRLDDWIGKKVTANIITEPTDDPAELVSIEGFLEGVDPMGIIVLFGRGAVSTEGGTESIQPDVPLHIFYSWRRIRSVERIEGEAE